MNHHSLVLGLWALLVPLGLTMAGCWQDLRRHEIDNWVSLTLFAWAIGAKVFGLSAITWQSLALGLGIGLAVGVALFASGGFGGGDAKLLAALGAALGHKGILITLLVMALAGGLMSAVAMARGKRVIAYGPAIAAGVVGYCVLYGLALWLVSSHAVNVR